MKVKHVFIIIVLFFISGTLNLLYSQTGIPEFNFPHGFYNDNFDLIVFSNGTNSKVKYTLDGSDPRTSQTAIEKNAAAVIHIDPESTEGQRGRAPGVTVRACTIAEDNSFSDVVTQTYLFVKKAASLSPQNIKPGQNWPSPTTYSNPQYIDYGMDADVINDIRYADLIDDALLSIPSISIVTDLKNLFDLKTGIYMNASQDGEEWERPASIELLQPDGTEGFQINAGIRIRGGASRSGGNPKHAFRFFFRSEYGKAKLKCPLFENEGVDEFDKMDLRTSQNYSWSFPGHQGEYNTMNRDVFSRDLQGRMGQPYTRSRYYHLYINGVYWGIYQTQERSEARYAASYFGGSEEDYDVIKAGDGWPAAVMATDGNMDAYRKIWDLSISGFQNNTNYFKLQGLNEDGSRNDSYKVLVDINNLIDFMIVVFYAGNFDSPITIWSNNSSPRNFYCIYNRKKGDGFKFFVHDAEHSLRTTPGEHPATVGLYENRVNLGTLTNSYKMIVTGFSNFHPQWLHHTLSKNSEYRLRFADRVYKHFFNEGCITPGKVSEIFTARSGQIEKAIIAESARWGDTYYQPARTKDDHWQKAVDDIVENYFPYRTEIVLNQLKQASLYPSLSPPLFVNSNKIISTGYVKAEEGYLLKIQKLSGAGSVKYTLDGSDPRGIGGIISASALDGGNAEVITITSSTLVKARVQNGNEWSAIHELLIDINTTPVNLKITEIHYHPQVSDSTENDKFEFLELKNNGSVPINLSGAFFSEGITYKFPEGTFLNPKQYLVLGADRNKFNETYGFLPAGVYSGQLSNSGETIALISGSGTVLFKVLYGDKNPWPEQTDGEGYSLVLNDVNSEMNDPANWRASYNINGSPGYEDVFTSIDYSTAETVEKFELGQNYPNPFNPLTRMNYSVKTNGKVTLTVYDILGRQAAVLVDAYQTMGNYSVTFSSDNLSSGLYFYSLQTNDGILTKKMMVLK